MIDLVIILKRDAPIYPIGKKHWVEKIYLRFEEIQKYIQSVAVRLAINGWITDLLGLQTNLIGQFNPNSLKLLVWQFPALDLREFFHVELILSALNLPALYKTGISEEKKTFSDQFRSWTYC